MKVALLSSSALPNLGGVELSLARILPCLRSKCAQVLALSDGEGGQHQGVHLLPLRRSLEPSGTELRVQVRERLSKLLSDFQPDIFHLWGLGANTFFAPLAGAYPWVITVHSNLRGHPVEKLVVRTAGAVVAVSQALAEEVGHNTKVIYHGVDRAQACPPPPQPGSPLLVVARLEPEKGVDIALQALVKIPGKLLHIVGDGSQLAPLKALAQDLGVEDRVVWRGALAPEIIKTVMLESALVMMPSRREGLGLVALEAAAQGRVVVASGVGGLAEVVDREHLVEPENPAALASTVEQLLANHEVLEQLSAKQWQNAQRFTWEQAASQYLDVYQELL